MYKRTNEKDIINHIVWCQRVIEETRDKINFDPLASMNDTETKEQALFSSCVDYLSKLEKITEESHKRLDNIVFNR